jgi:pimeloyl-ACP methyl ester carboxylesterase
MSLSSSSPLPEGVPAAVPLVPADVPAAVSVALLRATLAHGRPPAQAGASGTGRHVLFVHGLGHDAWDFAPLVSRLPDDVVGRAFDLPGFGPGVLDAPPLSLTMAMLVEALVVQARACPRPPVVVASSLGGHVALLAALADPGLFAGLVLLAPGGLVEVPRPMQAVLRKYYAMDAILDRGDDEIVGNSRRIFVRPNALCEQLAARKLAWHRAPMEAKLAFATPFSSIIDDVFARPVLADVHRLRGLPMLTIFGAGDVVVPLSSGRALEDRCRARLLILDRVGHCPHLEVADVVAGHAFAFAQQVFADAA